ncbi:MAG: hypothetical protein ACXVBH_00430 [Flavisolibacter sp.]
MKLPSAEEYIEIVRKKDARSLAGLYNYQFVSTATGDPWYHKSRRAIVFKADYSSLSYAIRFFLDDDEELFRRYHEVQRYLDILAVSWKTPLEFMDDEYFPAIKMEWVDGYSLAEYIDLIISQPLLINQLQSKLVSLYQSLEQNTIAHGNLNLNNIRLARGGKDHTIKLIDYDSMFIPAFREKDSLSAGTSSFQHPMRLSSDFDEKIDRFSIWVFLTALEAFKIDASLWTKAEHYGYDKSKQVLFNYRDLAMPQQSRAFQICRKYNNEALNFYAEKLTSFCTSKTLESIEVPHLYLSRPTIITPVHQEASQPVVKPLEVKKEVKQQVVEIPVPKPKPVEVPREKILIKKKEHPIPAVQPKQQQPKVDSRKQRTRPGYYLVALVVVLLAVAAIFFYKSKQGEPKEAVVASQVAPTKTVTPDTKPQAAKEASVFTSTSLAQFLFQLYQSYNKRDLEGILSNYTDSLSQYYDTYAVRKYELTGIIKNLFIKPSFYECQPDIRTLEYTTEGEVCKLSVGVKETIQANRRSKKENFSSTIQYTIDKSFKILSEKNIQ